jgi:hypothetical protein
VTRARRRSRAFQGLTAGEGQGMLVLLILLAVAVIAGIALGFVIKWLFIIAVIAALLWLIAFFAGRARANF